LWWEVIAAVGRGVCTVVTERFGGAPAPLTPLPAPARERGPARCDFIGAAQKEALVGFALSRIDPFGIPEYEVSLKLESH
jgi:hypothetical protein